MMKNGSFLAQGGTCLSDSMLVLTFPVLSIQVLDFQPNFTMVRKFEIYIKIKMKIRFTKIQS